MSALCSPIFEISEQVFTSSHHCLGRVRSHSHEGASSFFTRKTPPPRRLGVEGVSGLLGRATDGVAPERRRPEPHWGLHESTCDDLSKIFSSTPCSSTRLCDTQDRHLLSIVSPKKYRQRSSPIRFLFPKLLIIPRPTQILGCLPQTSTDQQTYHSDSCAHCS